MVPAHSLRRVGCLLAACLLPLLSTDRVDAAPAKVTTYFVAGVDVPVTVSVDGESVGEVDAASVLGPLPTAAGVHRVEFEADGWTARAQVRLDGPSVDVVVHRPADAGADPTVTVFANDVAPVAADRARLTVAHTAVVPPADIRVSGKVLFENIANGEFVTAEVPADTYSVDIVATGGSTPVFGPVDLTVTPGALNRVFAIGRPETGSMDVVVQVIPLHTTGSGRPTSVDAGEAGLVAPGARPDDEGDAGRYVALAGLVTFLAGAAFRLLRRGHGRR